MQTNQMEQLVESGLYAVACDLYMTAIVTGNKLLATVILRDLSSDFDPDNDVDPEIAE